ncbi:hypothetical protein N8I74_15855 [Chitiniphilus purpureus]|uniref:Uncharacterized protein n=1 Tax=Chitiniphilus purpureus TaxID=2981137 RepID=A0ABY6DKL2_9NEIS|nr:hypothetical protein [Chitiniphilus sp. CD1]UXY14778.1 hypothetical protein N8I74_15855 [Chitiniphilus sp. CD1]
MKYLLLAVVVAAVAVCSRRVTWSKTSDGWHRISYDSDRDNWRDWFRAWRDKRGQK